MRPALLGDPVFINKLKESVNKWGQYASILINHSHEIIFDSLLGEIQFWDNYRTNLLDLERQFKSPETTLTVNILKLKNQFNKKDDIVEKLNLRQKIEQVGQICEIMKEIQVELIDQSSSIDQLAKAVLDIFGPVKKLFQNIFYPEEKMMKLLENFSAKITEKLA